MNIRIFLEYSSLSFCEGSGPYTGTLDHHVECRKANQMIPGRTQHQNNQATVKVWSNLMKTCKCSKNIFFHLFMGLHGRHAGICCRIVGARTDQQACGSRVRGSQGWGKEKCSFTVLVPRTNYNKQQQSNNKQTRTFIWYVFFPKKGSKCKSYLYLTEHLLLCGFLRTYSNYEVDKS